MRLPPLVVWIAVLASPNIAQTQLTSVDEGSFAIMRAGDRVGREDFLIRSTPAPGGRGLVAQANSVLGTRRIRPTLNADSGGAILRYQSEVREDGQLVTSYSGQATRDHYAARAQLGGGESAREFRLPVGTVAAEDEMLHHLWFVARRGPGAVVSVLVPSRNVVETVRIELVGQERLSINSQDFDARRLRLVTDGSGVVREVWVDRADRILKASLAAQNIVAIRDDLR